MAPVAVGRSEDDEADLKGGVEDAPTFAAPGSEGAMEATCGAAVGTMDGGETGDKVACRSTRDALK